MAIVMKPTEKQEITRLHCPACAEKVRGIGLLKGSHIEGLTFKCKRCGKFFSVKTE